MKQNIYDNPEFFDQYMALRESGLNYNEFVEQPAIKSLITSLQDKIVLDVGCGTGNFAKYCVEKGAKQVIGVDISEKMIARAKSENYHDCIEYICMPIEDFQLADQQFDLIVSSLAIHYIKDYESIIAKISRFLKKNGEFIFSTEHPVTTARKAPNNWIEENGNRLYYAVDHYQEEGQRCHQWFVDNVIVYHRTISTMINTLIDHGLMIEKVLEPQATAEGLEKLPKLVNERRRPSFLVIKTRKKND